MSEDSFLCSKCGEIPEILNVHTDNSKIEFKCKNCGIYEVLIDEYFDALTKNSYFKTCKYCESNNSSKYYYCFNCKEDFCENCKRKRHSTHEYIEFDKKKSISLKHNKEFELFCFDCQENLCEEDKDEHQGHKIEKISKYNHYLTDINLEEINTQLKNIIEINNIILNNEEYFINSIKNIGKSFEDGNKRDSKDIKLLLNGLSKDIEISQKAIKKLKDEYEIVIYRKDKYLHQCNKGLKDEGFKYISQIAFNQLNEIDISKNEIKDIKPFNKMSLPFLEFLNLSYNEIENIKPVAELKSLNLKYIFLQRNKIEDIEPFLKSYFPVLKILRVEGNKIDGENEQDEKIKEKKKEIFKKIKDKFSDKFIYKSLKEQLIEFNKNYKLAIYEFDSKSNQNVEIHIPGEEGEENKNEKEYQLISDDGDKNKISIDKDKNNKEISEKDVEKIVENIVKIDFYDKKSGDKMLKYLFLIITYASENKIEKLILRNNNIKDASVLARINFSQLKTLDLAVNEIKDSNFLTDIKADNLENLYLDNNYLKNFYPILNVDVNKILDSQILDKMEEKEFKNLYKESEENRSKGVKPLLTAKFKKLKTLSVNNQNVDDNNNKNISIDDEQKKQIYGSNIESAFQFTPPEN